MLCLLTGQHTTSILALELDTAAAAAVAVLLLSLLPLPLLLPCCVYVQVLVRLCWLSCVRCWLY